MDDRTLKWLVDALHAVDSILEFTRGKTYDDYSNDLLLRSGVERQFLILGEALKRVRDHERAYFDAITGAGDAVAFRNVLSHNYDSIEDAIVWDTIEEYLDSLREDLRGLTMPLL